MAAQKINYICFFIGSSQMYGCASKEGALETPPPPGFTLDSKRVFFITYQPDNESVAVYPVPQEEVMNATLKVKAPKEKKEDE